jgi:hypothetical protein
MRSDVWGVAGSTLLDAQGGGAICAEDMPQLSVVGCTFDDCTAPDGAGGAIFMVAAATSALHWPEDQPRVSTVVSSKFTSCKAATAGGAVAMIMNSSTTSTGSELPAMSVNFEQDTFKSNQLEYTPQDASNYAGSLVGGAVCVFYTGAVSNVTNIFLLSDFARGLALYNGTDTPGNYGYVESAGVSLVYNAETNNVTSVIRDCTFESHTNAAFLVGGISGGALQLYLRGLATNVQTIISACYVSKTRMITDRNVLGGAVAMNYHAVDGVNIVVDDCTFVNNKAVTGEQVGYAEGAALYVGSFFAGSNLSTNITRCTFNGNVIQAPATSDGMSSGGAVLINVRGALDRVHCVVHNCSITSNSQTTAVGQAAGAGMAFFAGVHSTAKLTNFVVAISNCYFARNQAVITKPAITQGAGLGNGAGVQINLKVEPDGLVENASVTLSSCIFEGNVIQTIGSSYGAGLYVNFQSSNINNAYVTIQSCQFRNNKAITSSNDGGYGGASYISADTANVGVTIQDSVYVGNFASNNGGAVWVVQRSANPASNLQMIATPVSESYI